MSNKENSSIGVVLVGFGLIVVLIGAIYSLTVARFQGTGVDEGGIADRIAPIGKVEVATAIQEKATPAETSAAEPGVAEEAPAADPAAAAASSGGQEIYSKTCIACHASGAAGAPKLGDKAAWEPRIAQGMDALMTTVLNGKNAMPPRGTCMTCSDDELRAAVDYMISQSQ